MGPRTCWAGLASWAGMPLSSGGSCGPKPASRQPCTTTKGEPAHATGRNGGGVCGRAGGRAGRQVRPARRTWLMNSEPRLKVAACSSGAMSTCSTMALQKSSRVCVLNMTTCSHTCI